MKDRWIVHVVCMGAEEGEQLYKEFAIDKSKISLGNLTTLLTVDNIKFYYNFKPEVDHEYTLE
jgi:hypothetical protein